MKKTALDFLLSTLKDHLYSHNDSHERLLCCALLGSAETSLVLSVVSDSSIKTQPGPFTPVHLSLATMMTSGRSA